MSRDNSALNRQREALSRMREPETGADNSPGEDGGRHPALKNFSRLGAQAKHVLGGVFTGGLIGAGVGGAAAVAASSLLAGGAIISGGPFTMLPAAVAAFTPALPWLTGAIGAAGVAGAGWGALVVGGGKGLWALSTASDAADAEEDKIVNKFEQAQARNERLNRLREARDRQAMAMNNQMRDTRNPNRDLPDRKGMGMGMEGPAYT